MPFQKSHHSGLFGKRSNNICVCSILKWSLRGDFSCSKEVFSLFYRYSFGRIFTPGSESIPPCLLFVWVCKLCLFAKFFSQGKQWNKPFPLWTVLCFFKTFKFVHVIVLFLWLFYSISLLLDVVYSVFLSDPGKPGVWSLGPLVTDIPDICH